MSWFEIVLIVAFVVSGYTLIWLIVSTAVNNSTVARLEQRLATLESKWQNRVRCGSAEAHDPVRDAKNQDWD